MTKLLLESADHNRIKSSKTKLKKEDIMKKVIFKNNLVSILLIKAKMSLIILQ